MNRPRVIFTSKEDQRFEVDCAVGAKSDLVQLLINFDEVHDIEIKLSDVKSATLAKVVEWCEHHRSSLHYNGETVINGISQWDINFFNIDRRRIRRIVKAAGYLKIQSLIELGTHFYQGHIGRPRQELIFMGNSAPIIVSDRTVYHSFWDYSDEESSNDEDEAEWNRGDHELEYVWDIPYRNPVPVQEHLEDVDPYVPNFTRFRRRYRPF